MIVIDQRGCGKGKTTDGIYKRIINNKLKDIKTLVVVPSINLQKQYKKDLDIDVQIINSQIYNEESSFFKTTVQAAMDAMRKGSNLIIITHQTFIRLPNSGNRFMYDLIIDEALDEIIKKTQITSVNNDEWQPDYDLNNLFDFESDVIRETIDIDKDNDNDWYELRQLREPTMGLLYDSPSFRSITDKNYIHYVTAKGWNILNNQDGGTINVISVLNPDMLKRWRSVYIAGAAFEYTKMFHWLVSNQIDWYTPNNLKFEPHIGNIKLWTSDNNKFKWSNTKRATHPNILRNYHNHVKLNASGQVITIRNNDEPQNMSDIETRINHNVHGLNNLQNYHDISLESALIPDPQIKKFIMDHWLTSHPSNQVNRLITHMFSAYLFYQVVMRTKLRNQNYNNERINIFVLDQDTGVCLMDYFSSINEVGEMDITSEVQFKPRGRPNTSLELKKEKNRIRQQKYRDKKKNS